jgi:hypothetical protein
MRGGGKEPYVGWSEEQWVKIRNEESNRIESLLDESLRKK